MLRPSGDSRNIFLSRVDDLVDGLEEWILRVQPADEFGETSLGLGYIQGFRALGGTSKSRAWHLTILAN